MRELVLHRVLKILNISEKESKKVCKANETNEQREIPTQVAFKVRALLSNVRPQ
jgi:hypothetical protein